MSVGNNTLTVGVEGFDASTNASMGSSQYYSFNFTRAGGGTASRGGAGSSSSGGGTPSVTISNIDVNLYSKWWYPKERKHYTAVAISFDIYVKNMQGTRLHTRTAVGWGTKAGVSGETWLIENAEPIDINSNNFTQTITHYYPYVLIEQITQAGTKYNVDYWVFIWDEAKRRGYPQSSQNLGFVKQFPYYRQSTWDRIKGWASSIWDGIKSLEPYAKDIYTHWNKFETFMNSPAGKKLKEAAPGAWEKIKQIKNDPNKSKLRKGLEISGILWNLKQTAGGKK